MLYKTRIVAGTAMLAALGACGGTTSATKAVYSDPVGTAVQALDAGKTLSTDDKTVTAMRLNQNTGDTSPTSATVSLAKNSQGGLTLTVNGDTHVFTSADATADGYGYEQKTSSTYAGVFSWDQNSVADALSSSNPDYAQIWGYQVDDGTVPNTRGFAVLGTETKAADLKNLPTATYNGWMVTETYPKAGFVDNATSKGRLRGDVTMSADFGAGNVSGNVSNLSIRDPGTTTDVSTAGSIAMDSAPITGNGFSGTLTPSGTFTGPSGALTVSNGTYAGKFFGPSADQVGGTISLQGNYAGTDGNGAGFFKASK